MVHEYVPVFPNQAIIMGHAACSDGHEPNTTGLLV